MNNGFFPMGFLNRDIYTALTQNDVPPTLYSLMNSYVNFNKSDDEKTKIIDLPSEFREYLFDFDYPLDDTLKPQFEENFLTHYMMRRIGFDTYMAFKIHLKDKLNSIMTKFNLMLLEVGNLDFDGTKEVHTRQFASTSNSSSSGSSSTTSDNKYSDTPENELTDIQSGKYLTDYTYNTQTGSSNASANGTVNNSENITITKGDSTDEYIKMQNEMTDIYSLIYKELDSLFYGIIK